MSMELPQSEERTFYFGFGSPLLETLKPHPNSATSFPQISCLFFCSKTPKTQTQQIIAIFNIVSPH